MFQGKGKKLTYFLEGEDRTQRMRRISHERMRADRAGGSIDRDQRCVSVSNMDYRGKIFTMQNGMVRDLCQVPEHPAPDTDSLLTSPDSYNVSSSASNESSHSDLAAEGVGARGPVDPVSQRSHPASSTPASGRPSDSPQDTSGVKAADDVTSGSAYVDMDRANTSGDSASDAVNVPIPEVDVSGQQERLGSEVSAQCQHTYQAECQEPSEMRCLLDESRVRVSPPTRQLTHLLHGRTPETVL